MQMSLDKLCFILLFSTHMLIGYGFQMDIDNEHPMLGEEIMLTLHFHYGNLEEYELEEPHFAHFKSTLITENDTQQEDGTWLLKQQYTLVAQQSGTFTLSPLKAHIESIPLAYQKRYNRNKYLKKQDIFTKALTLEVLPLPQGLNVTGTYTLKASTDKRQTTQGSPVHFTLTLEGKGNIETLSFLSLNIPHTTIYETSNTPLSKTFTILSDQDYTIPPITLKYFNQKSKTIAITHTSPYTVHILKSPLSGTIHIGFFLFLLLGGSAYLFYLLQSISYVDTKKTFIKKLKHCKTKQDLLKKVAPYVHQDRDIERLIYRLEESEISMFKKIKKEILTYFYP